MLGHEEEEARLAGTMYVCAKGGMISAAIVIVCICIYLFMYLCMSVCINQRLPVYDRKGLLMETVARHGRLDYVVVRSRPDPFEYNSLELWNSGTEKFPDSLF